jgi:hypothetical protein
MAETRRFRRKQYRHSEARRQTGAPTLAGESSPGNERRHSQAGVLDFAGAVSAGD